MANARVETTTIVKKNIVLSLNEVEAALVCRMTMFITQIYSPFMPTDLSISNAHQIQTALWDAGIDPDNYKFQLHR